MPDQPHRVRLSRAKFWRMPPDTITVARPSKWGNPFRADQPSIFGGASTAAEAYRWWLEGRAFHDVEPERRRDLIASLETLRGKHLACWCRLDEPCHADVLLELANR